MPTKKKPLPPGLVVPPGMVARWDGEELIVEAEDGLTPCGHSKNVRCSECDRPTMVAAPAPSPVAIDPATLAQALRLLGIRPTEAE